jgi:hypothetical protein
MVGEEQLAFLRTIDEELVQHARAGETLELHLLGRSALVLGYGLQLMTKDVDVVDQHGSRLLEIAMTQFGKEGQRRLGVGLYLEAVPAGLPPLPHHFRGRCLDISGSWKVIRPKRPEVHDLIVSKLRRFHQGDREDVTILCDTGDVLPETLRARFEEAHLFSDWDDPKVVSALKRLEAVVQYLETGRWTS